MVHNAMGAKAVKPDDLPMFLLSPGDILWKPHGMLALPATPNDDGASMAVWPWVNEAAEDTMPREIFDIVGQWTLTFARKHAEKEPWKSMMQHVNKWLQIGA